MKMTEKNWSKRGVSLVQIKADFKDFYEFKFRQNLGITAQFFIFSDVNCVCEQRVDFSAEKVVRRGKG